MLTEESYFNKRGEEIVEEVLARCEQSFSELFLSLMDKK
jgi:hypothetical protein